MKIIRYLTVLVCFAGIHTSKADPFLDQQCGNIRQRSCADTCQEILSFCPLDDIPHSYMFTKPVYRSIDAQLALWHDALADYCAFPQAAQGIFWYQQSLHSKKIDRFFMFNDVDNLLVKGDAVVMGNSNLRDIRAEWLGLPSNFQGSFTVPVSQHQLALWPEIKVDLKDFCDHEFFERFWFAFAFPFQWVTTHAFIQQTPPQNPGPNFPNGLVDAFNNPTLLYGKFNPNKQKDAGAAEFNFKLGSKLLDRDGFQLGLYSLFLMPLHTHAHVEYVFMPQIGNNRHFGVGTGLFMQLPLNYDICNKQISFIFEAESIYFFRNNQRRIFDIDGKPWSRYLRLNKNTGEFNVPATQVLTRQVQVKPYNMIEAVGALRFNFNTHEMEIGYHVWARPRETVKLIHPFLEEWGIAGDGALVPGTNIRATAHRSTISHQADNDVDLLTGDPTFIAIKERDLNFQSAVSPAAISHRAYASWGFFWQQSSIELFINAGAYVEIPQYDTSLPNGGFWLKLGVFI